MHPTVRSAYGIQGFGTITRVVDLERFNAKHGLSLRPHPMAACGSLIALYQLHPREPEPALSAASQQSNSGSGI
jgi:hypothetical protein